MQGDDEGADPYMYEVDGSTAAMALATVRCMHGSETVNLDEPAVDWGASRLSRLSMLKFHCTL